MAPLNTPVVRYYHEQRLTRPSERQELSNISPQTVAPIKNNVWSLVASVVLATIWRDFFTTFCRLLKVSFASNGHGFLGITTGNNRFFYEKNKRTVDIFFSGKFNR